MLGHDKVDLLKMDIEGNEFDVYGTFKESWKNLPMQMVVELHYQVDYSANLAKSTATSPAEMALLLLHLASLGYAPVYRDDNYYGVPGCCTDLTLLLVEEPSP